MVAVLLIANLLATLPASSPGGCEALPSPLRVRITIGLTEWRDAEPTIRRLVEETWAPAGLRIAWAPDGAAQKDVDFWIAALDGARIISEEGALGFVMFTGDRPSPMARISIDAALMWARDHQARRLQTRVSAIRGTRADDPEIVSRVLGYAAAHEIGHFVLATKSHAASGVMKATYRTTDTLSDATSWQLDTQNHARLQQRLAGCGRRAAY